MKKRWILLAAALFLAIAVAAVLLFPSQEGSEGILFLVTGDNGSAYLLGSIHIGTSAMHPFGDAIQDAMAASDVFVFECDTSTDSALQQLSLRQTLPEDTTLLDIVGETLYADLEASYAALGLSTASLNETQPWAIISTLAVYSSVAEMGVNNINKAISLGVEPAVEAYVSKYDKETAYLETVDEVADAMESFSDELTLYLLQSEADIVLGRETNADDSASVALWPTWWSEGNAEAFLEYYTTSDESVDEELYTEYNEILILQRNSLMAARLDSLLQNGGNYFVTVGLLHLLSEDGSDIPSLLESMGYSVQQVVQE